MLGFESTPPCVRKIITEYLLSYYGTRYYGVISKSLIISYFG